MKINSKPVTSSIVYNGTVAGLPSANSNMVGYYARVNDLFGEKTDLLLCSAYANNTKFFWQPVRPNWMNTSPVSADQNIILRPLLTPSILRLTGTLTGNRTITPDKTMAYPGCQFEIAMEGGLGLFGLTILGLSLGNTLSMLLNGRRRIIFDGTDYQSY